ncbi:hypothetical protein Bca4012_066783 [Brassica carinata]
MVILLAAEANFLPLSTSYVANAEATGLFVYNRCTYRDHGLYQQVGPNGVIARIEIGHGVSAMTRATQGEAIRNYYHDMHVIQDMLAPLYKVYPIYPHKLYKIPIKQHIYPEPSLEYENRQGDTEDAQMYTDVRVYYAPGPVLRGEAFDGSEAGRRMEKWLIENHGFQPQYTGSELDEKNFWRMFGGDLYKHCRKRGAELLERL